MNATADERLVVMLEARIRDFEKNMQRAEQRGTRSYHRLRGDSRSATRAMEQDMIRSTGRINQALAATGAQIGAFGKAFAGGLIGGAVTAGVAAFTSNLRGTIRAIAEVGDEAKRAGMSIQAFQEWKHVAEQNRVGIDAMVDGFKELNLRADEFIVTGKGSAAEAFERLGYSAQGLKQKLQDPSALMLEIIGRLQKLDAAARIRIMDELLGGSGGEQFVQLIDQGEEGLRRTIQRGHELGKVMDEQMIAKAQELDRKFQDVSARVDSFYKRMVVGAFEAAEEYARLRSENEALFAAYEALFPAAKVFGTAASAGFGEAGEAARGLKADIAAIEEALQSEAQGLANDLHGMSLQLANIGKSAEAITFSALAAEVQALVNQMADGKITADQFQVSVAQLNARAATAAREISAIDGISMDRIIGRIGGISTMIQTAIGYAKALWASLEGPPPADGDGGPEWKPVDEPGRGGRPPPRAPAELGIPDLPKAKGGGRSKNAGRIDTLVAELQTEREILADWYTESVELLNGATEQQLEALGGRHEAIERLEAEHKERLRGIEFAANDQRLSEVGSFFGSMAALATAGGEKFVKAARVAGAAEALVNTLVAQSQVLRDHRLGFWGKMAAYTAIGAAGLGVVASLKGGGGSTAASAGATPAAATSTNTQAAPQRELKIEIIGGNHFSRDQVQDMIDQIRKEVKNGARLA